MVFLWYGSAFSGVRTVPSLTDQSNNAHERAAPYLLTAIYYDKDTSEQSNECK
ncbi:8027_t:CDS:2 [Funneliformis caledonium]|uniref:8027_t:CDS:1 n=1 Tax=Funneliformis caledonium TaxID=1117310 RepID=A0A9N8ZED8_9GLOM|nr:8027_t:CDS:2 [Funneliformis caledonium]